MNEEEVEYERCTSHISGRSEELRVSEVVPECFDSCVTGSLDPESAKGVEYYVTIWI